MAPTTAATARPDLPELPLDAWEPTRTIQIDLDLVDHRLVARTNRGQQGSFRLRDGLSVASFDRQLHQLLDQLVVDVPIREDTYGVPMTTPSPARPTPTSSSR